MKDIKKDLYFKWGKGQRKRWLWKQMGRSLKGGWHILGKGTICVDKEHSFCNSWVMGMGKEEIQAGTANAILQLEELGWSTPCTQYYANSCSQAVWHIGTILLSTSCASWTHTELITALTPEPNAFILKVKPGFTGCHDDATVLSLGTSVQSMWAPSCNRSQVDLLEENDWLSGRSHGTG